MFGKNILVAPVTEAGLNELSVYLPEQSDWFNFRTGEKIKGGKRIKTPAPLDEIPLFVKAGSILPLGKIMQYSGEKSADTLEIRIYPGANGEFTLYEDEGDNYNYEKGSFSTITFVWNEAKKTLTFNDIKGSFKGILNERKFNIVIVDRTKGIGNEHNVKFDKEVEYKGIKTVVRF